MHSLSMVAACCEASYLQAKDRARQGLLYGCSSEQCRRTQLSSSGSHGDLLSPLTQHPITVRESNTINKNTASHHHNHHTPSIHTLAASEELGACKDTADAVGCMSHADRDPAVLLQASASGAPLAAVSVTHTRPGQPAGPALDVHTLHGRDPAHTAAAPSWVATRSGILLTSPPNGTLPKPSTGTLPLQGQLLLRIKHACLCCCPKASSRAAEPPSLPEVQHGPAPAEATVLSTSLGAGKAFAAAIKDLERSIQLQLRVNVTNKLSAVKVGFDCSIVWWF